MREISKLEILPFKVYKNPFLNKVIIKVNLRIKVRCLNERQRSREGFKVICGDAPGLFFFLFCLLSNSRLSQAQC